MDGGSGTVAACVLLCRKVAAGSDTDDESLLATLKPVIVVYMSGVKTQNTDMGNQPRITLIVVQHCAGRVDRHSLSDIPPGAAGSLAPPTSTIAQGCVSAGVELLAQMP